jgi:histidinol-phosphate aminotransferase
MAFCDDRKQAAFPNISYGFYPVYADLNHVSLYGNPAAP